MIIEALKSTMAAFAAFFTPRAARATPEPRRKRRFRLSTKLNRRRKHATYTAGNRRLERNRKFRPHE